MGAYKWKTELEPHSIVKLCLNGPSITVGDEKNDSEASVPNGAQVIVLETIEDEDCLYRFRGLYEGRILTFYLFPHEFEVVFG